MISYRLPLDLVLSICISKLSRPLDGQGDEEDDDEAENELKLPGKVGTKKLRKLQMKAEKKAMREVSPFQ